MNRILVWCVLATVVASTVAGEPAFADPAPKVPHVPSTREFMDIKTTFNRVGYLIGAGAAACHLDTREISSAISFFLNHTGLPENRKAELKATFRDQAGEGVESAQSGNATSEICEELQRSLNFELKLIDSWS